MDFPQKLALLRKEKKLTQQTLANIIGMNVIQIRRYEGGTSQPTLDVIRKLAIALSVSSDMLIFGKDERGPEDDLKLQFEKISKFTTEEKKIIKEVLDGLILKHEAKQWAITT